MFVGASATVGASGATLLVGATPVVGVTSALGAASTVGVASTVEATLGTPTDAAPALGVAPETTEVEGLLVNSSADTYPLDAYTPNTAVLNKRPAVKLVLVLLFTLNLQISYLFQDNNILELINSTRFGKCSNGLFYRFFRNDTSSLLL